MAADFNLQGEIQIQLAKNAGNKLKQEIQGLEAEINLGDKSIDSLVKKIKAIKKVPVSLRVSNQATYDKNFAPKTVKVKLELLNSELVSSKAIKAAVSKNAKSVAKTTSDILRENGKGAAAALRQDLEREYPRMRKLLERIFDLGSQPESKFFKTIQNQVLDLQKTLGKDAGIGDLVDSLVNRFKGFDSRSTSNLVKGLESVYRAFGQLDRLEKDFQGLNLVNPEIDKAREQIFNLLNSVDAGNLTALETNVKNAIKPLRDGLTQAVRDARSFDTLLSGLKQRRTNLIVAGQGANSSAISQIDQQIKTVQKLQTAGKTFGQARDSDSFREAFANAKEAQRVTDEGRRALEALRKYEIDFKSSDLIDSEAAQILQAGSRITKAFARSEKAIADAKKNFAGANVTELRQKGAAELRQIPQSVEKLQGVLDTIDILGNDLIQKGIDPAIIGVDEFRAKLVNLAKSDAPLNKITKELSFMQNELKASERSFRNMESLLINIDRIGETAFQSFAGGKDFSGVVPALEAAKKNIQSGLNKSERELKAQFNKDVINVRDREKLNTLINNNIFGFQDAAAGGRPDQRGAFERVERDFRSFVDQVVSGGEPVRRQYTKIKDALKQFNAEAVILKEGGFLNAFAKSTGIAVKRLSAFLVFGPALYSLQSGLLRTFSAALSLETQFAKVEQILSKNVSLTGSASSETARLTDFVFNLSKSYGVASSEIAQTTKLIAQTGKSGRELEQILTALTKSALGPTFADINQTGEAAIAILNQFSIKGEKLEEVLGGIARVSGSFAVEAEGIATAVRKAGGAFSAASPGDGTGVFGEFVSAFTVIKEQTREADEAIATGLRNISIRLQRGSIQKFLKKELNVDLVKGGQFIGIDASIKAIGESLRKLNIEAGSPVFSNIIEKIAGARQFARLQPLILGYERLDEVQRVYAEGAKGELDKDVGIALETTASKLTRLSETFQEFANSVINTTAFKILVDGFTGVAKILTNIISLVNSLPGQVLTGILALKALSSQRTKILSDIFLRGLGSPREGSFAIPGRNSGGIIPGGGPDKDSVLTYLTKGEYVIPRKSVKKYGVDFLDALRRGVIPSYNVGGEVGKQAVQSSFQRPNTGIVGDIKALRSILRTFLSSFKDLPPEVAEMVKAVRVRTISEKQQFKIKTGDNRTVTRSGSQLAGVASKTGKTVYLNPKTATGFTPLHEGGHIIDRALGASTGRSGTASSQKDTFQHKVATEIRKSYIAAGKTSKYRLTQEEIFADVLAKTTDEAKQILTNTTDVKTGSAQLAELFTKLGDGPITGLADLNASNFGGGAKPPSKPPTGGGPPSFPNDPNDPNNRRSNAIARANARRQRQAAGGGGLPPSPPNNKLLGTGQKLSNVFSKLTQTGYGRIAVGGALIASMGALASTSDDTKDSFYKMTSIITETLGAIALVNFLLKTEFVKGALAKVAGPKLAKSIPLLATGAIIAYQGLKLVSEIAKQRAEADLKAATSAGEFANALARIQTYDLGNVTSGFGDAILSTFQKKGFFGGFGSLLKTPFGDSDIDKQFRKNLIPPGTGLRAVGDFNIREVERILEQRQAAGVTGGIGVGVESKVFGTIATLPELIKDLRASGNLDANREGFRDQANQLSAILKKLSAEDFDRISTNLKNIGFDSATIFKELGIDILKEANIARAFDSVGAFLDNLEKVAQGANARLTGLDANLQQILNANEGKASVAAGFFDNAKRGFGASPEVVQSLRDVATVDPNLAKAAQAEIQNAFSARTLSRQVSSNQINVNEAKDIDTLIEGLRQRFGNLGGSGEVFETFLRSQQTQLEEALVGGSFDPKKINDVIESFINDLDKGNTDAVAKWKSTQQSYLDSLTDLTNQRLELEQKIIGRLNKGVDLQQQSLEFRRRARGQTGPLSAQQAAGFQNQQLNNLLLGTGIQDTSVAGLSKSLRSTDESIAGLRGVRNSQNDIAKQQGIREKIVSALEYIADGGTTFESAMERFNKAAEKAAASSDRLTNAMTGTDAQFIETIKAQAAFNQVTSASSPEQARALLLGFGDEVRAGVGQIAGSSTENKELLQSSLGTSPLAAASPEAKAVQEEFKKRQEANNVLIGSQASLIESNNKLSNTIERSYQLQTNMVNQFAQAADKAAQAFANIPNEVNHNFNVGPIVMRFEGAAALNNLNEAVGTLVEGQINEAINNFGNDLQRQNKGIKVSAAQQKQRGANAGKFGQA